MTGFDEYQHPRGHPSNPGAFAEKDNTCPETDLAGPTRAFVSGPPACHRARQAIQTTTYQAGYGGAMPGVLNVLVDRYRDDPDMLDRLAMIDAADVEHWYDIHVGPALDQIEDDIRSR